jgi:ribosomal protein S17
LQEVTFKTIIVFVNEVSAKIGDRVLIEESHKKRET